MLYVGVYNPELFFFSFLLVKKARIYNIHTCTNIFVVAKKKIILTASSSLQAFFVVAHTSGDPLMRGRPRNRLAG